MENKINNLLDYMYNSWFYNIHKRDTIEYFINNNLDLRFISRLDNYLQNFDYHQDNDRISLYKESLELKEFLDNNNLNRDYFWFRTYEDNEKYYNEIKIKQQNNKKSKKIKWHIYIIQSWEYYKIWRTKNIKKRKNKYITENPNEIIILHSYEHDNIIAEEKRLHKKFSDKKHNREWFSLSEEDILYIKQLQYGS